MEDAIAVLDNLILLLGVRVHETNPLTPAVLETLKRARRDLDDIIEDVEQRLSAPSTQRVDPGHQIREATAGTPEAHLN